eukprot:3621948-Amphidinium_carterae.1
MQPRASVSQQWCQTIIVAMHHRDSAGAHLPKLKLTICVVVAFMCALEHQADLVTVCFEQSAQHRNPNQWIFALCSEPVGLRYSP